MFKKLFSGIQWFIRQISPGANFAYSMFLRQVAVDLIQQYVARNPKTAFYAKETAELIDALAKIANVKQTVAVRVIESVIAEVRSMLPSQQEGK